jgi:hypothetical protein
MSNALALAFEIVSHQRLGPAHQGENLLPAPDPLPQHRRPALDLLLGRPVERCLGRGEVTLDLRLELRQGLVLLGILRQFAQSREIGVQICLNLLELLAVQMDIRPAGVEQVIAREDRCQVNVGADGR